MRSRQTAESKYGIGQVNREAGSGGETGRSAESEKPGTRKRDGSGTGGEQVRNSLGRVRQVWIGVGIKGKK